MSDDRSKPQYGEYATPEQQAAAMGRTYVPPPPPPPVEEQQVGVASGYPRQSSYVSRFVTIFLLALGGLNLITGVPTYLDLSNTLRDAAEVSGTSLHNLPSSVNGAGIPLIIANVVIYALTVVWAVFAIRRGRASVYIPIVGFLFFGVVLCVLLVLYAPGYFSALGS
jgi:hypothetical protein